MKTIVVKTGDKTALYSSGSMYGKNEKGETVEIKQTKKEMKQRCYNNLIDDIRQQEFEKNIISILQNYLTERQMSNWVNIEIDISYSDEKKTYMKINNKK